MIIEKLTVSPLLENCYIVGDPGTMQGVVIDPGDEAGRIAAAIRRFGLTVTKIVNTHGHVDHVGAVADLKDLLGAAFYLHPAEKMHLERLPEVAVMFGIQDARVPVVDVELADGDTIMVGELAMHVVHTPGHTPGHCVLVFDEHVFCGDLIFAGSIGRTDLPGGDYPTIVASLEKAILTLPEATILYPGHGPATTVAIEKQFNPFLRGLRPRQS
jgi:glyoxylase-like metal-dependent hydrolase (beta-lactamase superfamily II)